MDILYVDGAALDVSIGKTIKILDLFDPNFDYARFFGQMGCQRVFYYDALPTQRRGELSQDFELQLERKQAFFASLGSIDGVHVKNGTTKWERKRGQHQKAVDVRLAVDVISHALTGVSSSANLLVNDIDFFPIFETLRNSKVTTRLIYDSDDTSDELIEIADRSEPLWISRILTGFESAIQDKFSAKPVQIGGPISDEEKSNARRAYYYEQEVFLWRDSSVGFIACINGVRMSGATAELAFSGIVGHSSRAQQTLKTLLGR